MKTSVSPVVLKQKNFLIRYPPGNCYFLLFVGIQANLSVMNEHIGWICEIWNVNKSAGELRNTPRQPQSLEIHTDETQTNTPQNTAETISSGEVGSVWERYCQTADIFHMILGLREQKNIALHHWAAPITRISLNCNWEREPDQDEQTKVLGDVDQCRVTPLHPCELFSTTLTAPDQHGGLEWNLKQDQPTHNLEKS